MRTFPRTQHAPEPCLRPPILPLALARAAGAAVACAALLSACGGGGSGSPPSAAAATATQQAPTGPRSGTQSPAAVPPPLAHASDAPPKPLQTRPRPAAPSASAPEPKSQSLYLRVHGLPESESVQVGDGIHRHALKGADSGVAGYILERPLGAAGAGELRIDSQPATRECSLGVSPQATPPGRNAPMPTADVRCHARKLGYSLRSGGIVDVWAVRGDDSLQHIDTSSPTTVDDARALAVAAEPTHSLLYVAGKDEIRIFQVQPDAALKPFATRPLPKGSDPVALVVHPARNMLFVACRGSYQVLAFWINTQTGALQQLGAVSTLTDDARIPGHGIAPQDVKGARLDARPEQLLVSLGGDVLYVGDSDGRIEAFTVHPQSGSSTARPLPGQVDAATQSSALSLLAQAKPFDDARGLSMACDTGCRHLLLTQASKSELLALPAPVGDAAGSWKPQTIASAPLVGQAQAMAFNTATGTLYLASHEGSSSMISQYAYDASGDTPTLRPLMTPNTARAEQTAYSALRVAGDGRALYAVDPSSSAVWQFDVDVVDASVAPGKAGAAVLRGQLTPMSTPDVTTPAATLELQLEP